MVSLWMIAGGMMFVIYNIIALEFASRVLEKSYSNFFLYVAFAIFKLRIFVDISLNSDFSQYIYIIALILVSLEFKLLSNSSWRQVVFGSSVFLLHISSIHVSTTMFYSYLNKTDPHIYMIDHELYFRVLFSSFFLLTAILLLFKKLMPIEEIKNVSSTKIYSEFISFLAICLVIYITSDSIFIYNIGATPYTVMLSMSTLIFGALLFYLIFLFTLSIVRLHYFKRKSDEAEDSYKRIFNMRSMMEDKLSKDEFTGLYNKEFIVKNMEMLLSEKKPFGVIYLDLTALKYVNDTYGHQQGDEYVLTMSNILKKTVREYDLPARFGGDEFFLLLNDIEQIGIDKVTTRIKREIKRADAKAPYLINANMGCLLVEDELLDFEWSKIVEIADELMRMEKRNFYEKVERV